jgi:hypothetical protein
MSQGPRFQVEPVQAQDSSTTINVVFDESTGNMAIDYSDKYERIATALETLASLASTTGVRTVSPYEWLGLVSSYQLYVEANGAIGLAALEDYKDKINDLPKSF